MGAVVGTSRGRQRKFADNLNLVPFIDLFSTIVIFLLSTAVWDQLAGIQANLGAGAGGQETVQTPKEFIKKVTAQVRITLSENSIELFDEGQKKRLEKGRDRFDFAPVEEFLSAMRAKYGDKKDMVIVSSDGALYEDLIGVMDRCLGKDFTDLVVTGEAGKGS